MRWKNWGMGGNWPGGYCPRPVILYIYVTLIRISPLGEMVKVGSVLRRDAVVPLKWIFEATKTTISVT